MLNSPAVWICGVRHVGNLGPVADKEGCVAIEIRDLDQTVIGNPAHDLIRLALSIETAARGSDLPCITITRVLEQVMQGNLAALPGDLDCIEPPPKIGDNGTQTIRRALVETPRRRAD